MPLVLNETIFIASIPALQNFPGLSVTHLEAMQIGLAPRQKLLTGQPVGGIGLDPRCNLIRRPQLSQHLDHAIGVPPVVPELQITIGLAQFAGLGIEPPHQIQQLLYAFVPVHPVTLFCKTAASLAWGLVRL
ncbi:hypothetical protein Rifp1Sym_ad00240 [endosymbiont of Riftia pachyptila (vent Ph05)]|uniref:Uncharacterized protein n=1 Tax=endosymbiont of Riftia pachyptila (vent Ph05) TaxID=1048808 RepID=G2D9L5_9GAMM|nr:hypothetical protein Rifp1Sym_ad00240 [endosymbiont of Riftia pachyptila (vent Ph05)]